MSKKILLVSNTTWSLYNFRLGLMEILKQKGFEVLFCAPYDKYAEILKERGFKYFKIKNLERKGLNPIKEIRLILELYQIYKKIKPDLVLHFTIKPNIWGTIVTKLINVKCFNTITGLGSLFVKKTFFLKAIKFLYKLSFKFSQKIFFQNKEDLEFFLKNKIVKKEKTILVPGSGVDIGHFHPDFCKRIKKDSKNFIFLFVGRLLKEKGLKDLVEATKIVKHKYPNIEVWLLGNIDKDNPSAISEKKLKEWQDLNLVKYLGFYDDIRPFLCRADCFVFPSYYREGIPRSLLEAGAMEKPIITTNNVGCKEVVEEEKNGFLVPPKDPEKLAKAMIKMIEISEEKRKEMGKLARQKILKEFDQNLVINFYLQEILKEFKF